MRKIEMKTKVLMLVFSLFIGLIGASFAVAINALNQKTETEILLKEGAIIFVDTRKITLEEESYIKRNFRNEWQMTSKSNKVVLGENVVIYDKTKLLILGGGYQVMEDQTVEALSDVHEVTDLASDAFYKLQDRRYVFVAEKINTGSMTNVTFDQFVYVALDKAGYGQLYSVDQMMKTTKELEIESPLFNFNISRETLKTANAESDLKRMYGTTSSFLANHTNEQDLLNKEAREDNPEVIDLTIKGGDGGKGGKGGSGGKGGIGGGGGTGVAGGGTGSGGVQEARKSMQFKEIKARIDKLEINYLIIDPLAQYGVTWLYVYEENSQGSAVLIEKINIDPMGQNVVVQNLKPDTQYSLKLGYTSEEVTSGDGFVEQDGVKSMTKAAKATIQLVMQTNTKLIFNVKVDKDYLPDTLKLKMVDVDNNTDLSGMEYDIDIGQAMSETGYSLSVDFDRTDINLLQLVVKDAIKNGVAINFGGHSTFTNKFYVRP